MSFRLTAKLPLSVTKPNCRGSLKHSGKNVYTLKEFEKWLDNEMQQFFNSIANILAANDESKRGDKPLFARNNHSSSSKISKMICWYFLKDHKLAACKTFISLNLEENKTFFKEKQVCWNCLSEGHKIKDCASTTKCRIDSCNKKHHTLLYDPSFKPVNLSNPVNPITNPSKESIQNHVLSSAFTNSSILQIIPVILKSGKTWIRTNALLDTSSAATLVRSDIANYLKLDGVTQNLKIANAALNQKPLQTKLVSFEIYSNSQPDPFTITNAWVVPNLSVKYRKYNPNSVKLFYTYLRDLPIPKLHPVDVTLILGTDFLKLLLNQEYKKGKHCESYATKTYLGWVLMDCNKRLNTSVNSNLTQTVNVECFWEIKNYGTVSKQDDQIMTKDGKRTLNISQNTILLKEGK